MAAIGAVKTQGPIVGASIVTRAVRIPNLVIGAVIITVLTIVAVAAPLIAPYPYYQFHLADRLQAPSGDYLFGTDIFGRDVFSRVLYGARISLTIGVGAAVLSLLFGAPLGLLAGYFGGWVDQSISRVVDIVLSFPPLLLAMLVLAVLSPNTWSAMGVIGVVYVPRVLRIVRSVALSVRTEEYVEAAHARAEVTGYILFREMLPNAWSAILVEGSLRVSFAILLGAALGFLGLGAQPPAADWGLMISEARGYLTLAPWAAVFPGIAMCLTIFGFNLFADGVQDLLDPKTEDRA
jgi:peptide/nickel transport system permease protein